MDVRTILNEVDTWPVEDRLQLMEQIWEGLDDQDKAPELTEDVKALLDRRVASLDANPENVMTWDANKEYVRRPR